MTRQARGEVIDPTQVPRRQPRRDAQPIVGVPDSIPIRSSPDSILYARIARQLTFDQDAAIKG
jgi:hypothetical protein